MRDPAFAQKESRLSKVWRKIREDIQRKHPEGLDLTTMVLKGQGKKEWRIIVEEVGYEFFVEFWMRSRMSGRAGLPGTKEYQLTLNLDESYTIIERDEKGRDINHRNKALGDLTKQDMVWIKYQKEKNIEIAQLADDDWSWLCDLVFPIFDREPTWTFRKAWDQVCTDLGGTPTPPSRKR